MPENIKPLNENVAIQRCDGEIILLTATGPFFTCRENDKVGIRLAQANLRQSKLATATQIASAFNVNRTTVNRNLNIYLKNGAAGFIDDRSDRKPYKLDSKKQCLIQDILNEGHTVQTAAKEAGVTHGCIRYAIKKGIINLKKQQQQEQHQHQKQQQDLQSLKSSSERSREDANCSGGIGVKREVERFAASAGKLTEALPSFSSNEGVRNAGVLLAIPALLSLGYLDVAQNVYGSLKKGFYGLKSTFLIMAFMALLRIKNPEQLKNSQPGDLGIILGLDRAPEVKTLRRKLRELGNYNKAYDFLDELSKKWIEKDSDIIGFFYVDGHVRPYHGRKHKIPKTHVARRRLCMPATTDFWVNGSNCEPVFFVTSEANNSLLSTLKNDIIPNLQSKKGKEQNLTVIFDREGWSPKSYEEWACQEERIDVITYRKGKYDPWPLENFVEVESHVRGKTLKYLLGEQSIKIKKGFWVREVRRLCDNGHQTSIITTRQDLPAEEIARRMFFRWNQENYFKYMREEFNLDHLVSRDVEQGNQERMVPNPFKKEQKKNLEKLKKSLKKEKEEYGEKAVNNDEGRRNTMRGFNIANSGCKKKIVALEKEINQIADLIKQIPDKVMIKEILDEQEIIKLETEKKRLTDTIKMTCYQTETLLVNAIGGSYARDFDEGRAFIKSVLQHTADIVPDKINKTLTVNFHTMSSNRKNVALKKLCEVVNVEKSCYPGTDLKMIFSAL